MTRYSSKPQCNEQDPWVFQGYLHRHPELFLHPATCLYRLYPSSQVAVAAKWEARRGWLLSCECGWRECCRLDELLGRVPHSGGTMIELEMSQGWWVGVGGGPSVGCYRTCRGQRQLNSHLNTTTFTARNEWLDILWILGMGFQNRNRLSILSVF